MTETFSKTFSPEDISRMTPKELLERNISTQRLVADLPISSIVRDRQLIEPTHAEELGDSMTSSSWGQISAIVVRARLVDSGEIVHDVIDGFHRTEGRRSKGLETIKANVLYGCSDEEMNDHRILSASSVKSVKFARQVRWINEAFSSTTWAEKGLSVHQAFGIAVNDVSRSNIVDLTPEEIADLKEWVSSKSVRWEKTINTIYQELRLAALAAPDLLEQVRTASGGTEREVTITQAKLSLVVNAFPGEKFHELQRTILNFAVSKKLKMDQIRSIIDKIDASDSMDAAGIYLQISDAFESLNQQAEVKKKSSISPLSNDGESFFDEEGIEIPLKSSGTKLSDEELRLDAEEPPEDVLLAMERKTQKQEDEETSTVFTDSSHSVMRMGDYVLGETSENGDKRRIADLERALEAASKQNGRAESSVDWWETASFLQPFERDAMRVFMGYLRIEEVAGAYNTTENQVLLFVRSAIVKHYNSEEKSQERLRKQFSGLIDF